ncbi:MAG: prepilin-type N-terminal cleavage/methylation domain-containing protein [Candidatus Sericytochromatia bacterium]|uniref:Prepilin-type N-terminal cleavage/methylation domain-containing protein n=1 Tax=Candidatus Tanganyikabacteria bacterium TaxID=2961651 RepID=A0A938BMB7_9BACT|nr:prepilin-type N-terminal cleavage/methylation domain-containing protein [Candidatus Tanganyikabacteria bacterium]
MLRPNRVQWRVREARIRNFRRLQAGFTLAELLVAAVVLLIASVGVLQTLSMMVRHSERHHRDLQGDQLARSAVGYMRDVGYDGLRASGSALIASAIASQYDAQMLAMGKGSALSIAWLDTIPGKMLDATVSVKYPIDQATQSIRIVTRVAKGGPM